MIRKRLRKRDPARPPDDGDGYQPRLVITVDGLSDVYRIARHLELGQVEFHRMGRAILRSMDDQAPGVVAALTARMGPATGSRYRGRRPRPVQLRLGMPEADLRALEAAVR